MAAKVLCEDDRRSYILNDTSTIFVLSCRVKNALSENPNLKSIRLSMTELPYQVHFVVDNRRLTLHSPVLDGRRPSSPVQHTRAVLSGFILI